MSEKSKCPAKVVDRDGMFTRSHSCGRSAAHEHEGVLYCKTHHPPTVKAKDAERSRVYIEKWDSQRERMLLTSQAVAVKAEFGFTPRGLVEQIDQLREALNMALVALEAISDEMTVGERYTNAGQHLLDALNPARAALANTERKT